MFAEFSAGELVEGWGSDVKPQDTDTPLVVDSLGSFVPAAPNATRKGRILDSRRVHGKCAPLEWKARSVYKRAEFVCARDHALDLPSPRPMHPAHDSVASTSATASVHPLRRTFLPRLHGSKEWERMKEKDDIQYPNPAVEADNTQSLLSASGKRRVLTRDKSAKTTRTPALGKARQFREYSKCSYLLKSIDRERAKLERKSKALCDMMEQETRDAQIQRMTADAGWRKLSGVLESVREKAPMPKYVYPLSDSRALEFADDRYRRHTRMHRMGETRHPPSFKTPVTTPELEGPIPSGNTADSTLDLPDSPTVRTSFCVKSASGEYMSGVSRVFPSLMKATEEVNPKDSILRRKGNHSMQKDRRANCHFSLEPERS